MEEDKLLVESEEELTIAALRRVEKVQYERELRGLEIRAYSGVLEALRASGKPTTEKDGLMKTVREFFKISEDRHKSEMRVLAFDDRLSLISQKLNGQDYTDEWAFSSQREYIPLGPKAFSIYKTIRPSRKAVQDPVPSGKLKEDSSFDSDSDDSLSESDLDYADNVIENSIVNGWQPLPPVKPMKSFSIAVDFGMGNEKEIEEIEEQAKKNLKGSVKKQQPSPSKSPDITDAPRTPIKLSDQEPKKIERKITATKPRGMKRKRLEDLIAPLAPPPTENSTKLTAKKLAEKSKNLIKIKKSTNSKPKIKIPLRRSESKKAKESSEETSSADEGENGPIPPEESSRVMSPVFSEVIRTSVLNRGGGRGFRSRSNVERRRNNILNSTSGMKSGKSRPRTPNQKSAKYKSSAPTTGSRRKSKLNEKIDYDEVLMDMDRNELNQQHQQFQNQSSDDNTCRRVLFDNQSYDKGTKEYSISDDCAVYTNSLPNINYNHEDMVQVTDGVFKRPLPPKGLRAWDVKEERLNNLHRSSELVCDENMDGILNAVGDDAQRSTQIFSPPKVNSTSESMLPITPSKPNEPLPPKKQRIKSPLIVSSDINPSPNVAKVPLSSPVFSTSLSSSVSKKRSNNSSSNSTKPTMSLVDSMNLHLPTSATASSLAASSNNRRPGAAAGGGCSMFSNSSALIAGARGTAPGILQQQRKAQPHILSNSKIHQRTFLPNCIASNNGTNASNNMVPMGGTAVTIAGATNSVTTAPVAAAGHAVQLASPSIPISAISSNPTTPLPFQNFPSATSPTLNMGPGVPVGHVNRCAPGTNFIFVQKANGPLGPAVSVPTEVPSGVIPLKTPPRTVILRRAQVPRQGNVMILDMQKNQLVSPVPSQASPFLQTARVLNSSAELSFMQPTANPRKAVPVSSFVAPATAPIVSGNILTAESLPPQQLSQLQLPSTDETIAQVTSSDSYITLTPSSSQIAPMPTTVANAPVEGTSTTHRRDRLIENDNTSDLEGTNVEDIEDSSKDAQYAQIEAELMQMEEGNFGEVVYEEEVTTEIIPMEDNDHTQYIFTNETCSNEEEVFMTPQEPTSHNASTTSGSSTDTASENETSLQNIGSPENDRSTVTKVTLSPTGEVKLASEAISRALSLSKSSAKRLTFTTPISLGTAATLVGNLALSNKSSIGAESVVTANSNQINIVPSLFQATKDIHPTAVVIEADPSSTKSVHLEKSGIEFKLHTNEIIQQSQPQVQAQENANVS